MADGDEDEWEYEYDEYETEHFSIPIDLSNVPSAQVPMNLERRRGHPTMLKSRLRALNATRGQLPELPGSTPPADEDAMQETATLGEVQVTGLHTPNPLVMYNGQLLSCQWTSTIGTDMFFTKPETDTSVLQQRLRSLPSVDLLSLGTAKLVARVGSLQPRDDIIEKEADSQPPSVEDVDTNMDESASLAPSQAAGGNPPTPTVPKPASTNFLARLNEAKAKRGEPSRLIVNRHGAGLRLVSEFVELPIRSENGRHPQGNGDVSMSGT